MKTILIVIDGLGDKPIPKLKNKTPLESAKTPNLDWLAKNGVRGLVLPFRQKGKLPTSEDTHLALFGFNPKIFNPGRGVLEVLGIGMKILPGDVCLRGNFATLDTRTLKIIDRRAGRIEDTRGLIKAISGIKIEGVKFLIGKAVSHRIGIVMRGRNLSPKISDNDSKKEGIWPRSILPKEKSKKAIFTSDVLNQFLKKAHLILKNHPLNKKRLQPSRHVLPLAKRAGPYLPANYILVRGAGSFKRIKSFRRKYGLRATFIAGGTLYKGIGKFLGMKEIKVEGANGLPNTNLKGKILAAKRALKKYDFAFCHIKAADNLAEDGKFLEKKEFIEKIDRNLKPLLRLKNTLLVITADHSTSSLLKRHCLDLIPVLIWGEKIEKSGAKKFSEKTCKKGALGKIKQIDLMHKILSGGFTPTP